MASLGHVALGLVARKVQGVETRGRGLGWAALWVGLSLLPDLDVVGFGMGVAYSDPWGHRGATHSFVFAACIGIVACLMARAMKLPAVRIGALAAAVVASHPLLDILTDGGLGCALLWPFSTERFFAGWRPIPVAPIGPGLFSARGLYVIAAELLMFTPVWIFLLWPRRLGESREARNGHTR